MLKIKLTLLYTFLNDDSSCWFASQFACIKFQIKLTSPCWITATSIGRGRFFRTMYTLLVIWSQSNSEISCSRQNYQHWKTCNSVLFLSRPLSEGWPHHGRTFPIYPCHLSFWLTLTQRVLSTSWCCPSRPCVAFLTYVHLALFLALSHSQGNYATLA